MPDVQAAAAPARPPVRRAFVGFYGLNRSARWTARSIRRNIILPLRQAGFELLIAGHFNLPDVIDSAWSNERGIASRNETGPLALDMVRSERQSEANIADFLPAALSVPWLGRPDDSGQIRRNMSHQLHSLRRLDQMLQSLDRDFDLYILLRPDLEYIDRLQTSDIDPVLNDEADIVTPNWEEWGGLNDRFAFCNRQGAAAFLRRWQRLDDFCRAHGYVHAERLLADAVRHAGLRQAHTGMRAIRVRANGRMSAEDFPFSRLMWTWYRVRGRLRHGCEAVRQKALRQRA